jgi:thioesterase domain-containing protein
MDSRAPGRLIALVRRGDRPVCVMLPGAGGGVIPYMRLAAHIGRTHDVYVVRAAGLVSGEVQERSVDAMAAAAIEALDAAAIVPQVVFGWSLGGAVAWEVCVRLADRAELPALVVVDAAPLPRASTAAVDASLRSLIVGMLGPRPPAATVELVGETLDAQLEALAGYRASRPYPGRVLLLMCTDGEFPERAAYAERWRVLAPHLCSGRLAAGHFDVFDPLNLPQLADQITAFLGSTAELAPC